ncbi:MAG: diaminopimelate decarboxylase family protein [Conexivisphaera sp.]
MNLAEVHGTPYFLIDELTLRRSARDLGSAYSAYAGDVSLAYSVKANFLPRILSTFHDEGLLFDVATVEELYFLERTLGSVERSIYTSATQTYREFARALELGVKLFVVGSLNGLQNLARAADNRGTSADVLIRINPELDPPTDEHFYKVGKYGVPIVDEDGEDAVALMRAATEHGNLKLRGFHFHVGTQVSDPTRFTRALDRVEELLAIARTEGLDFDLDVLDIGGGMPVTYYSGDSSVGDLAPRIVERLNALAERLGSPPELVVESGRFLVAESGVLASRVVNVKRYAGLTYAFLDTGYHNLLDAALVKQVYPVRVIPEEERPGSGRVVLAGMLCDSDDVFPLGEGSGISGIGLGKLVVFGNAGAYSIVFNMPFHAQPKPPVLFRRSSGAVEVARPRETIEELFEEEGGAS